MKAIIIAAGKGKRMKEFTSKMPKCLLEINGKKLLDTQLDAFKSNGIDDISIIVGYQRDKINYSGLKYYINDDYEHNNILNSPMYAAPEMDDAFIAVYSDIIFDASIVTKLMQVDSDIAIVVDTEWQDYYAGRVDHPIQEAENVIFDTDKYVTKIGKIIPDKDAAHGEFIGMMKCSKQGADIFKKHFNYVGKIYKDKPFQTATTFNNAYLTDMIQDLADSGTRVYCVTIKKGWREIDTVADYKKAIKELS